MLMDNSTTTDLIHGNPATFSQTFFLSAGEVNAEGEIALPLLIAKIIDISTAHANSLGIGNPSMAALGRGWVLSRLALEMESHPVVNSTYRLTTWIESWNRHFSERIIMVSDADGNPYGYARTIWMVLDYNSHESTGLSHLSLAESMILPDLCPIPRQGKNKVVFPPRASGELPREAVVANTAPMFHAFGYSDLDFYRHVNTVRYVALLLNQYKLQEFDAARISRIELWFVHEGLYGHEMMILQREEGNLEEDTARSIFTIEDITANHMVLHATLDFRKRK